MQRSPRWTTAFYGTASVIALVAPLLLYVVGYFVLGKWEPPAFPRPATRTFSSQWQANLFYPAILCETRLKHESMMLGYEGQEGDTFTLTTNRIGPD